MSLPNPPLQQTGRALRAPPPSVSGRGRQLSGRAVRRVP